ncbi:MAG: hypothetical protein KDB31_08970 [Microthrixaceae bacterium]|nr:hypothetical protein [Microthrixaceae bacterium]
MSAPGRPSAGSAGGSAERRGATTEVVAAERIEFEVFARVCDLHPELLARFADLGLVRAETDAQGRRWLQRRDVSAVARVRRLRSGLGLSYSAIAVVAELIDRIDDLETALRWHEANSGMVAPPVGEIRAGMTGGGAGGPASGTSGRSGESGNPGTR